MNNPDTTTTSHQASRHRQVLPTMKSLTLLLLAFYSLSPATAQIFLEGEVREGRRLQGSTNTTLTGKNNTLARRIQEDIDDSLPAVNFQLRGAFDDPYPLGLVATVPIDCGTLTLNMEFDELIGLSTVNIERLTIDPGSVVGVPEACDDKKWAAKGDILVSFGSSLVATRTRARLEGRCKGQAWSTGVSNSLSFSGVSFTGTYNLQGISEANATNITQEIIGGVEKAETLGALALNISSYTATVGGLPPELQEFNVTISNQLAAAFRKQIVDDIEPEIRELLEIFIPTKNCDAVGLGFRSVSNFFSGFFSGLVEAAIDTVGDGLGDILG